MKYRTFYLRCRQLAGRAGIGMFFILLGTISCNRIPDIREQLPSTDMNFLSTLPTRFVENVGQTLAGVLFHAEGAGHTLLFESSRVVFHGKGNGRSASPGEQVILGFPGSSVSVEVHGLGEQKSVTNYYMGSDPSGWHTGIPTFCGVAYEGLYPGIDMVCSGDRGTFKNEFLVAAGADPGIIRMSYQGARRVEVSGNGDLLIETCKGTLVDAAPVAYQETGAGKKEVRIRYRVRRGVVSFRLGAYDPDLPLVIDPEFTYVTYYSGNDETIGQGVAVDRDGYLLHAGYSLATDLPVANATGETNAGADDVYAIKVDTATGDYVYATYIGGSISDIAWDFAIDDEGNAYITGFTESQDFPVSDGAYQTINKGEMDVFLTKLGPDGSIVYSTFLGGSSWDFGYGLALNANQEVYLTGYAGSMDFPVRDPYQDTLAGSMNAFVSKISAGGDSLLYSTYLGGDNFDGGLVIALDMEGYIYVGGEAWSTNFPLLNAQQETHGGLNDGFITRLDPAGQTLEYSTYLGGEGSDVIYDMVVDTGGNVYVCGGSDSPDFPEMPFGEARSGKNASNVPGTKIGQSGSLGSKTGFPGMPYGQVNPRKCVAGIQDTGSEDVEAFVTFYNVVGQMAFCALFRQAGFNYFRKMVMMSGGIDPFLLLVGYLNSGLAVKAYAIRDYSKVVEDPGPVNVLEIEDTSHYYYPRAIDLIQPGLFTLDFSTDATIPTRDNGTPDPNPEPSIMHDNVIIFSGRANLKVTITAPDSLEFGNQLVLYVKVENTSARDARLVSLMVSQEDPGMGVDPIQNQIMEEGCAELNKVCMLGTIPAGSSVEKIVRLRTSADPELDYGTEIVIEAAASGANTNRAEDTKVIRLIDTEMSLYECIISYLNKKSTHGGMVDLYVNDELVADNLQVGIPRQQEVVTRGIRPKIDITDGEASDNLDPIASDTIDLCAPGMDHLISPRNHQLILVEDPDGMIHIHHKRDMRLTASDPARTEFFVVHGAGEIGDADIRLVDPDNQETVLETLFDDLAPDSVTGYVSFEPGRVAIELTNGDNSTVFDVVEKDLSLQAGVVLCGVIVPVAGGEGVSAELVISELDETAGISQPPLSGVRGLSGFNVFPNPSGSITAMTYYLDEPLDLEVVIYSAAGSLVRTVYRGIQGCGEHQLSWDGHDEQGIKVPPGTYLCMIRSGSGFVARKLTRIY